MRVGRRLSTKPQRRERLDAVWRAANQWVDFRVAARYASNVDQRLSKRE
jgi:hypothetical protein